MQTRLEPMKIALVIDNEILEEISWLCMGELTDLETRLEKEEDTELVLFLQGKILIFKRLDTVLDNIYEQLDNPGWRRTYRLPGSIRDADLGDRSGCLDVEAKVAANSLEKPDKRGVGESNPPMEFRHRTHARKEEPPK